MGICGPKNSVPFKCEPNRFGLLWGWPKRDGSVCIPSSNDVVTLEIFFLLSELVNSKRKSLVLRNSIMSLTIVVSNGACGNLDQ